MTWCRGRGVDNRVQEPEEPIPYDGGCNLPLYFERLLVAGPPVIHQILVIAPLTSLVNQLL